MPRKRNPATGKVYRDSSTGKAKCGCCCPDCAECCTRITATINIDPPLVVEMIKAACGASRFFSCAYEGTVTDPADGRSVEATIFIESEDNSGDCCESYVIHIEGGAYEGNYTVHRDDGYIYSVGDIEVKAFNASIELYDHSDPITPLKITASLSSDLDALGCPSAGTYTVDSGVDVTLVTVSGDCERPPPGEIAYRWYFQIESGTFGRCFIQSRVNGTVEKYPCPPLPELSDQASFTATAGSACADPPTINLSCVTPGCKTAGDCCFHTAAGINFSPNFDGGPRAPFWWPGKDAGDPDPGFVFTETKALTPRYTLTSSGVLQWKRTESQDYLYVVGASPPFHIRDTYEWTVEYDPATNQWRGAILWVQTYPGEAGDFVFSREFISDWVTGDCCGFTDAPVNDGGYGETYPPGPVEDGLMSAELFGIKCCKDADGNCQQADPVDCAGECDEEGM